MRGEGGADMSLKVREPTLLIKHKRRSCEAGHAAANQRPAAPAVELPQAPRP